VDKAAAGTASRKAAEKTPTDVEMSDADKKEGRHLTAGGAPVGGEPGKGAKAPIVQPDIMHRYAIEVRCIFTLKGYTRSLLKLVRTSGSQSAYSAARHYA
jgi:hypothetical protein